MRILYFIVFILLGVSSFGATYSTIASGDWTNDAIWNSSPADNDCSPNGNDTYNINHAIISTCPTLSFSGTVTINVANGASFLITGAGGITGSVKLNAAFGSLITIIGDLNLGGSSDVLIDGVLLVQGSVIGAGSTFDCNGTGGLGLVSIGGTGCSNCTNALDMGCTLNVPLPVNLSSFTAHENNDDIAVSWTATYEKDNDHFILERSRNGVDYEVIHNLTGKVNTNTPTDYSYADENLSPGKYFYRLVQIDLDGTKTRTEAVSVTVSGTLLLTALPNPGEMSQVKINVTNADNSPVLIVLMDIAGNLLYSHVHHLDNSAEVLSVRELYSDLSPGIYYISASSNDLLVSKKIVVY